MFFFKKKKEEEQEEEQNEEAAESEEESEATPQKIENEGSALEGGKLAAELSKVKAQVESFAEIRKVTTERFTRISEQIGELRGMIMDVTRTMSEVEVKAAKSIDMVETVQPDKLMINAQKQDAKVEALRANIESNEVMMKTLSEEVKELRRQLSIFKGLEQVIKLNEEAKQELKDMKLVKAQAERHADKVADIFIEIQKKFGEYEKAESLITDFDRSIKQLASDFSTMKIKMETLSTKSEVETLITKFKSFEAHAGNVITILDERFADFRFDIQQQMQKKLEKAELLLKGFETLAKKTPNLDKYFNLLTEEARNIEKDSKVEKIEPLEKEAQKQEEQAEKQEKEQKSGFIGRFFG